MYAGRYPANSPSITLPSHLQSLGLREHVLSTIPAESEGSPILYQMIDAARAWVDDHPLSIQQQVTLDVSECSDRPKVPTCKFFLQGKCRFGDKCRNSHGSGHASQVKNEVAVSPNDKPGKSAKSKSKAVKDNAEGGDKAGKKAPMRTADDVISRILWDPDLPSDEFKVGYLDRFVGVIEKPFSAFSWEDLATVGINVLAVPKHRIQYFKFRDEIVWDKSTQMDNFFGSRGGRLIQGIVAEQQLSVSVEASNELDTTKNIEVELKPSQAELIEIDDNDGVESASNAHMDQNRPTHFVCFHITSDQVKDNVSSILTHITTSTPQLAAACLPNTALHVTLCMVRLENDHQISIAKEVLENSRLHFIHALPRCSQLSFTGVSNFCERLVYAKVAPSPALDNFVFFLLERFQEAGLRTPGNHKEYTAHMTLVKLSRPMQRELQTGVISPALYQPFLNTNIGSNCMEKLSLCSMTGPKVADGFYLRLCEVSNSLSGLPSNFVSLLTKRLDYFFVNGIVTEIEHDRLSKAIQGQESEQEFDMAIEEIICLGQEETMCSSSVAEAAQVPVVISLRGVPGSGKSFLATHSSEYLSNPSDVAVCSADSFFMESGAYRFSSKLLPKAHTRCLKLFLQACDEGKKFIMIDNTNSKKWEYEIYGYISSILGCRFYILEVPCPSEHVLEAFRSRNQHNIDRAAGLKIFQRWEVNEKSSFVPPSLAYPRAVSTPPPSYSLVSLCTPKGTESVQALDQFTALTAIYVAIFLTPHSQWKLVSTILPTLPRITADHVTLVFEPEKHTCLSANIGSKVTVTVTGCVDDGQLQVATVKLPHTVSCQNTQPHVTISAKENVSVKLANEVLQRQQPKQLYQSQTIELEGVIGVMVHERNVLDDAPQSSAVITAKEKQDIANKPSFAITSETDFKIHILPRLAASSEGSELDPSTHICTGKQKITNLYIFDFDGTLFSTPEPKESRRLYENYTGKKWERKGWLVWPESLLPPVKTSPGPALPTYREHVGQAGSMTVILTGRINRTKTGLLQVLDNYKVYPEQLITKPDKDDESTPAFKARIVQQLLKKFHDITLVKFWDDNPKNLAAVHNLSMSATHRHIHFEIVDATNMIPTVATKQGKKKVKIQPHHRQQISKECFSSTLEAYLAVCGFLPNKAYLSAANFGVHFIAEQFCKLLGYSGDPFRLIYVFGSFPLGRKGDVDVCLLCPPHLTPTACLEQLWRQLGDCGINYLHKGYSRRCPRLKIMLEFPNCSPIDYDIVFATISDPTFFNSSQQTLKLPAPEISSLIKHEDSASKTAITGAVLLHKVLAEIDGIVSKSQFCAVVEMIVHIFSGQRQKGNAYNCIRTFHIVRLLSEFIKTHRDSLKEINSDLLFGKFVRHAAEIPDEHWKKLFGEYVPVCFIPKVRSVFEYAAQKTSLEEVPSTDCYEELMQKSVPYPPEGFTTVEISLSGSNAVALWKLHTIIEALFPSYIRQLISLGLDILPDGNTDNVRTFAFAVPLEKSTKQTLQQVLRPFWNEIAEFRKEDVVNITLNFGQVLTNPESSQGNQRESSPIVDKITEFASDPIQKEMCISQHLTSYERLLVYEHCEQLGLSHNTVTSGKEKHISIKKK